MEQNERVGKKIKKKKLMMNKKIVKQKMNQRRERGEGHK
ncbi:uncharacterized protein G2W53_004307 [Senna tora]|uniref:Uncharacterized protein n=1 Tax=Senna tora TaxID=362788 RepID=A0A835CH59_9FABA|nr:uncharacterized protein G2W53_004307 [Senna tora]